ncbi:Ubiquitin carboxyl-terminal hydrolase [Operophtera brumata]|uniref:ubiquitinyl hydrolase 1 n=1 Tax=Operophtera brumata TaxID=104452 RepID=A0A0L7LV10_OPEBR|nr:Ubiquitin carboxyl-terminal hydrolase [Operophtera brumata]
MENGVTCEHLNKLTDILGKDLWQSKEALTCFDCGCSGPNLWICLQPDCHHAFPAHCVHMNVSTERIWCYVCEKEVHIKAAMNQGAVHPMFRGYHQHDTQEFLRCFMDQLHEELKEPVWDSPSEDKLSNEADGDHTENMNVHVRRRAASSGGTPETIQRDNIGSESELSWSSEAEERYETCSSGASDQPIINHNTMLHGSQESWVWWLLSWLRSWFYGPVVSLQDCLAACSRCNKLRNGVKMSGVVRLPEVLCVHLKRFRHELMFSAKVAARVSFPISDLNMAPYTHKAVRCDLPRGHGRRRALHVRRQERARLALLRRRHGDAAHAGTAHTHGGLCALLQSVICHAGTAGGGHYTCVAKNARGWHYYDDATVTPLTYTYLCVRMHWFRQWQAFVRNKTRQPPPPVDNSGIVTKQENDGQTSYTLKQGSDHAQLSEELWRFFTDIYAGGPEVKLKSPTTQPHTIAESKHVPAEPRRLSRKYSESDKEDYCTKSTSEMNIRDTIQSELQKNQSLQNINRQYRVSRTADSDEDVTYRHPFQYTRHEPNGNYDSDEDMEPNPPRTYMNTVRMENGIDSSDHDANDNPVKRDKPSDTDLPNMDSISLKSKPKSGKVRKIKRRTVK